MHLRRAPIHEIHRDRDRTGRRALAPELMKLGHDEDAVQAYRQALKSGPNEEVGREARFRLAVALQQTGKADEAATLVENLLKTPFREKLPAELLRWLSEYRLDAGNLSVG